MSDGFPSLPSASVERAELIATSNATNLYIFLMGSYMIIYFGTLYLYLTRKAPQRVVVVSAITILYVISMVQFGVQWFLLQLGVLKGPGDLDEAYISIFDYPTWSHLAIDITTFLMFIVADGLLIWRCYHVCGRSFRIILLPLFLVLVETGLFLASTIYIIVLRSVPSASQVVVINDLQSGVFFVSFATSLATTVAIAHRIYTSARETSQNSRRKFNHIIEIIIQSAAVYSVVLLVAAISGSIPDPNGFPTPVLFSLSTFSTTLLTPAAGMVPTIMVARVSLANSDNSDNASWSARDHAVSELQFGPRHARPFARSHTAVGITEHSEGRYDSKGSEIF